MDKDEKIRFLEDCIVDIRAEIKKLEHSNTMVSVYLMKRVKPMVDSFEIYNSLKDEENIGYG